ncbi:MAG TPA: protein kinase [Pirellulales bacterium]|nr:protein kinase [Pirellulales bacterium]
MPIDSKRVQAVFLAAVEADNLSAREAVLKLECGGDPDLRQRVMALLAAHDAPDSLLDLTSAAHQAPRVGHDPTKTAAQGAISEAPGALIGPFKLLQHLGEGGFGVVYMAEQSQPVRRMVALKIIKPGMDTAQVIARFESERQALALMDHPNIAKVLDAGATASGRPYFVMELVKGVPITEFCDKNHLPPEGRLRLFIDVCHAIQHAHHKSVIHRDIKPTNVMVTLHDGVPMVKVIDFGVAKATVQKLTERTLFTAYGQMIGTPAYMSPEQAEMSGLDIDTRSDVYSLGVLLYELLTGTTPLEAKRLREAGYAEMQRMIREEESPRPSTRISSLGGLATVLAGNRGLDAKKLAQVLAGDLDWIAIKALDKDRNRRYGTPGSFAEDIERYLKREAILARPPSAAYKLRKFVQRNRAAVATAAVVAASLVAGVAAVVLVQANANRERAAAETERASREAWTTASVAAAIRDARERAEEAWNVADYPDRMQLASDAAVAALRRADEFVAGGTATEATLAELASARHVVDELARHTRLVTACVASTQKFADDIGGQKVLEARARLADRHGQAFRQFGLDPVHGSTEDVAKAVAANRLRDALLGALLEWQLHVAYLSEIRQNSPEEVPDSPAADPIVRDRLALVIRTARQLCGGAYARWQDLLDRDDVPGLVAFAASPDGLSFRSILANALGRDLREAGEVSAWRTFLRAAVDRYPHDVFLHYDLFEICHLVQPPDYAEALRHLSAASVQRPDSGLFHLQIGTCYAHLESYDNAIAAYRKAIALRPDSSYAIVRMGDALLKKKDWDGAITAFRDAERVSPKISFARFQLGVALQGKKDWDGAATAFQEAVGRTLSRLRENPAMADDPRKNVRYYAVLTIMNCADAMAANTPHKDEGLAYRKQALDLLADTLAATEKLAATDPAFVHRKMQRWLAEEELQSTRDPMVVEQLPPDQRDAWKKFWADVRELCDRTAPATPERTMP